MKKSAPLGVIYNLDSLEVPELEVIDLGPHKAYIIPVNKPGPVKIDLLYPAGRYFEQHKSESYTVNALLKEGSRKHSSEEISSTMEFYGAAFGNVYSFDLAGISLMTLDRHWSKLWPLVLDSVIFPHFPQAELDLFVQMNIEELKMEEDQTEFLAYRQLTQLLFGSDHPYGYNSSAATYQALTRQHLQDFHSQQYMGVPFTAIICAKNPDVVLKSIEELIQANADTSIPKRHPFLFPVDSVPSPVDFEQELKGKQQVSLRWGRRIPDKNAPDFCEIFILNAIFGGYFGSRLIERIREKEGMSYQVFSSVDTMRHGACWMFGADITKANLPKTNRLIKEELIKLQEEVVSPQELVTVKNYLMGQLMNNLDGPINISELLRSLLCEGQDFCYIKKLINVIKGVTASDLQHIAVKYANWQDFTRVRIG